MQVFFNLQKSVAASKANHSPNQTRTKLSRSYQQTNHMYILFDSFLTTSERYERMVYDRGDQCEYPSDASSRMPQYSPAAPSNINE